MHIKGLDKAEILAALYNNSKQQGLGLLDINGQSDMSIAEAVELMAQHQHFDYLRGRIMKVDLSGDELDTRWYNRDNGEGAAERVIDNLKETEK